MLGSGTRGTLDQLSVDDFQHMRGVNLEYITTSDVASVEANVVYAVARKM